MKPESKREETARLDDLASGAMGLEKETAAAMKSGKATRSLSLWIKYLLPVVLTVLLVWYMFSKVDFGQMMEILRGDVAYQWILLAMGISVVSHVVRAARWRLQLRWLGIEVPFMTLCCSIFGCYSLNLVIPRGGELWRCTYIASRGKAPFTTVLGSLVGDRLTDTLTVLCLTLLTFIVANGAINSFLERYPIGRDLLATATNPTVWIGVIGLAAAVVALFYFLRDRGAVKKLRGWLLELWAGFASLWKMEGRIKFLALTLGIWGCYYLQLYVAFYAFGFTKALCLEPGTAFGLTPCLVAFVLSAIGMAIPSNGGLGPWNIAVMFGLSVYGISDAEGTAFSMLQWSGQTVMLILLGIFTMIYVSINRKPEIKKNV